MKKQRRRSRREICKAKVAKKIKIKERKTPRRKHKRVLTLPLKKKKQIV